MDRQQTIGLGALFLLVVGVIAAVTHVPETTPAAPVAPAPSASSAASANVAPAPTPAAIASLEAAVDPTLSPDEVPTEGFDLLIDGRKAPPLPDSAPQEVTFGVVIYSYQGAQLAPAGARTKDQAKQKALSAVAEAQHDFAAAAAKGDHGSTSNAGRLPRGMLESAAEYVLFTLGKGEVAAAPVDTPRGYWILRRIN
jgi:hypothetical protein